MQFDHESNYAYRSRRSVVLASTAAVASSQPMATEAGLEVLRAGGSAADAAVAVAAALQVTQACS
ncbi:MAG TPA: gamma-glutamyltransferase, partial [Spirochaetia bacterium]|nr:gamma-glutamyltransferase [Spirochaetia bacterium]